MRLETAYENRVRALEASPQELPHESYRAPHARGLTGFEALLALGDTFHVDRAH